MLASAGAHQLWFHLYRMLFTGRDAAGSQLDGQTVQAVEHFVQTATLGEYRERLSMLWSFR